MLGDICQEDICSLFVLNLSSLLLLLLWTVLSSQYLQSFLVLLTEHFPKVDVSSLAFFFTLHPFQQLTAKAAEDGEENGENHKDIVVPGKLPNWIISGAHRISAGPTEISNPFHPYPYPIPLLPLERKRANVRELEKNFRAVTLF